MTGSNETAVLARFAAETSLADIPERSRRAGRMAILNWFGCAIAGSREDAVAQLLGSLAAAGCSGSVPVLGRSERLNALAATLVNGTASAVLDFDSPQHRKTNIHPSGPIAPALLSLAHGADGDRTVSGADFLTAYVLGVEVACRIANTVFGANNPGWHVTGAAGGPGAAVAVSRLLGASPDAIGTAIGIAATQSAGLREMYGTMCKALTPGRAGESGLLAALLAVRGFTSAALPLEGPKGLAAVFTAVTDVSGLTAGLGDGFEVDAMAHKPYPCAVVTHAVIDACIDLRRRHAADEIDEVMLTVSPIALDLAGKPAPRDGLEAKFSLSHAASVALVTGEARVSSFTEAGLADQRIARLRRIVRIETRPDLRKEEAVVRLTGRAGRIEERHVAHALGSPGNPMTETQLTTKFIGLAEPIVGRDRADQLAELVLSLETVADVRQLTELCIPTDLREF